MQFKAGDRVHVTRLNDEDVDFYATLKEVELISALFSLSGCSNTKYEKDEVWKIVTKDSCDYYVLAADEEDDEPVEIIRTDDQAREQFTLKPSIVKEMTLSEMIEWGVKNDIRNKSYITSNDEGYELYFDLNGTPRYSNFITKYDTFKIVVEEDMDKPERQSITKAYNKARLKNYEAIEIMQDTPDDKIELDNHYIIEVKKGLYVRNATSNYFFKFTKDINKADVYEYENAAMKQAEFVDGRVLNLKRYVEVE